MSRSRRLGPIPPPIPGRITMVGPCAAGKSTLARGLDAMGYQVHKCGQEHSHVHDMWQRLARPEWLIYLDVSIEHVKQRRNVSYGDAHLQEQKRRLWHAREHAHLVIDTDNLSIEQVLERASAYLAQQNVSHE